MQDEEASRVIAELLDKEEAFAKQHAKMLQTDAFKYERGTGQGVRRPQRPLRPRSWQSELECERLLELAKLFEFPEKADQIKETCTTMRGDLVKSKALWDLTFMVEAQIEVWKGLLWDDIQPAALEEESKAFQKIVKGMDKSVRMWDVYLRQSTALVKNFLVSVPAVSELKSPAMRQRHWDKLMEITGATLPVSDGKFAPEFCLADLLALQLHKYVDDVGEVVDQANKEDKMEQHAQEARRDVEGGRVWLRQAPGHRRRPHQPRRGELRDARGEPAHRAGHDGLQVPRHVRGVGHGLAEEAFVGLRHPRADAGHAAQVGVP